MARVSCSRVRLGATRMRTSEQCATHPARAPRESCRAIERTGAASGMPLFAGAQDAVGGRAIACENGRGYQRQIASRGERTGRGVRRSSTSRNAFRRPSRASLFSFCVPGSPPHRLTLRAPAVRAPQAARHTRVSSLRAHSSYCAPMSRAGSPHLSNGAHTSCAAASRARLRIWLSLPAHPDAHRPCVSRCPCPCPCGTRRGAYLGTMFVS
jgi:hypothetical protein